MTADTNLSARLASLRAKATDDNLADEGHHFRDGMGYTDLTQCNHGDCGYFCNRGDGPLIAALWNAMRNGQLVTLADAEAMVAAERDACSAAERDACSAIADAYAEENITMAGDSVIFDPVLSSKRGDALAPSDFRKSEELMMSGAIHSSMFHAAQNIAAAIRARGAAE